MVFAPAPAFSKLGFCVLDRMGPAEPVAVTGGEQIHSQHLCARPEIIAKSPPSMSYARGEVSCSGPYPGHLSCSLCYRDSLAPGSNSLPPH